MCVFIGQEMTERLTCKVVSCFTSTSEHTNSPGFCLLPASCVIIVAREMLLWMEAAGALQVWPQFRRDNDSACDRCGLAALLWVSWVHISAFCVCELVPELCLCVCVCVCVCSLRTYYDLLRLLIELSPCQCYWSHLRFSVFDKSKCRLWKGVCGGWMVTVEVRFCRFKLPESFSSTELKTAYRGRKTAPACLYFFQPITITLCSTKATWGSDMHLQNTVLGDFACGEARPLRGKGKSC